MDNRNRNGSRSHLLWCFLTPFFLVPAANAADLHIFDGDSFEFAVENLDPGDTLTVHEGTYIDSGRISIYVAGTASQPVVIQAAPGEQRPLITRVNSDAAQNTINIEGASYLTIRGLEISSNGGDGVNMSGSPSYITLEDLVIHDISVGINFRSSMHHITVRGNHIYNTNDTGEGMYVGCNYGTCAVSESLIEGNWIHDTQNADQGDGIEIKRGSHSNVIRNNVIHDTYYPCILLYGTDGNPRNIVEGNAMWNCGDSGIQAAADSIIRNNLILDGPGNAFNSQSHQGVTPANLEFVHNTIYDGSPCVRLSGWGGQPGLVFANNAVYCPDDYYVVGGLSGVTVAGNVFEPAPPTFPANGYTTGRSAAQDFIDIGSLQAYPSFDSALIGAGDAAHETAVDFNGNPRQNSVDAGAYNWSGDQNPGWYVAEGFKDSSASPPPPPPPPPPQAPTVTLAASPGTVAANDLSTLNWSSTNASSCTASGAWTGPRNTNGSEQVGPLTAAATYTLSCTGAGGTAQQSVTVQFQGSGNSGDSSGSGSAPYFLSLMLLPLWRRLRRQP